MQFTMTIDMDNAAIEDNGIAVEFMAAFGKVLRQMYWQEYHIGHTQSIMDSNGNRVGSWKISEENS